MAVINVEGIIEEVDALWKKFQDAQNKHSNCGATDTEPDYQFENAVRIAIRDDKIDLPRSAGDWELYSTKDGVEVAARELHGICREICVLVQLHRGRSEFIKHVTGKLWRVDV